MAVSIMFRLIAQLYKALTLETPITIIKVKENKVFLQNLLLINSYVFVMK